MWPEVTVSARLDAEGRLHVHERQVMRFTGDWNGGQRTFNTRYGQEFWFLRLYRIDAATGARREVAQGDLSQVDRYDWSDGSTVRWRSRLPSDPPFDGTEIVYELDFLYGNILQPRDGSYILDHDFAFADREGEFSRFELTLEIDSAWQPPPGFTGRYEAIGLPPGQGFVVTVPLTRVAASRPESVRFGARPEIRQALVGVLGAGAIVLFILLVVRERRSGRLRPLISEREITPDWLEHHVFAHLPEVVGASWDDETAAPEVAATLARMVQERKLSSMVKTKKFLVFGTHVLHLRLEVSRNALQEHERALVDALFSPGETTTDTERVRERYKKTGFDPASVIRGRLTELVESRAHGAKRETPSRIPTIVLIGIAIVLTAIGIQRDPAAGGVAAAVIAVSLPLYAFAGVFAYVWRRRITRLGVLTLGFLIPLGVMIGVFAKFLLLGDGYGVHALVLAGLVVWMLALANSVFNLARSRQSVERIEQRRRLAAAREFFRRELGKAQPAMHDSWFPYVLAFGLGRQIDRWFRSFGGESTRQAASSVVYARSGGGSVGGSASGSWTGFGGGGGFGGAGGGAAFGAAIGGMAASVPSPSSSSSGGGGGGGGGSSGGGGGGGW